MAEVNELKSLTMNGTTYNSFPDKAAVRSINGEKPDANGNVEIQVSGGNADQSANKYLGDITRTPIYRCLNIYLDGDTTGMTKENAVMLDILILDEYGNVKFDGKSKTAWQGAGSLAYPNKNLSLKLREKNDVEAKVKLSVFPHYATSTYHLKCNYADYSMVRNSVGASMAMGFDDTVFPVDAPMVVSSIPAILYLNGEFNGCYTLNTKQDDDLFGMDTKENPLTQIVYRSGLNGWGIGNFEYRSDGDETAETKAKLQRLLDFAAKSDDETFVRDFDNYLDLRNAINYWIFADVSCASDNLLNNWTIATWDGSKWYMLWYDLDIIFGLFRNAGLSYHPSKPDTNLLPLQYTVPNPIWEKLYFNFFDSIKERYWELRNSGALNPSVLVDKFRTFQTKWGADNIAKDRAKWSGRLNPTDDIDMMHGWIKARLTYLDAKYSGEADSVMYTITNNLQHITTSNSAIDIVGGSAYNAVLTANDAFAIDTVTVTMGGNVVDGAWDSETSTITIANVTGHVVITATVNELPVTIPEGYTRLAYLEGTGTQFIDTGKVFSYSETDEFYLRFAPTVVNETRILFGAPITKGVDTPANQLVVIGGQFRVDHNSVNTRCAATANEIYEYAVTNKQINFSALDAPIAAEIADAVHVTNNAVYLFGKNNGGQVETNTIAKARIYSFYYRVNGVSIINLVPVLDSDGVPCMYDTVSRTCLYNAGTGTFAYEVASE
jgi:hypothetical protein